MTSWSYGSSFSLLVLSDIEQMCFTIGSLGASNCSKSSFVSKLMSICSHLTTGGADSEAPRYTVPPSDIARKTNKQSRMFWQQTLPSDLASARDWRHFLCASRHSLIGWLVPFAFLVRVLCSRLCRHGSTVISIVVIVLR